VEQVLALQDWFIGPEGGFEYDVEVPPLEDDRALIDFVLEERVGHCVYFASAMAVMLRETGIPARVAVGFLPGRLSSAAGEDGLAQFTVSSDDAHAWVEVLFPAYGWLAFEPTPRAGLAQIVSTLHDLAPIETLGERRAREALEQREALNRRVLLDDDPFDHLLLDAEGGTSFTGTETGGTGVRDGARILLVLVASMALLGCLGLAGLRSFRLWDRSGAAPERRIRVAQRVLLAAARAYGVGRLPHETLAEAVERGRITDDHATSVAAIQAAVFGGEVGDVDADDVTRQVHRMIRALHDTAPVRARALAPLRVLTAFARASQRADRRRRASSPVRPKVLTPS
jgi:hypothetical protein